MESTYQEKFYPNGSIRWQEWYLNEKLHRENGPASIGYYSNGSIRSQTWFLNGEYHRYDGPAIIIYHPTGSIWWQEWYLNGKRHRENDPALIDYLPGGSIEKESWWLNGKELTKEEIARHKRKISNNHKVLLLQSSFSSFNEFEKWLIPEIVNLI